MIYLLNERGDLRGYAAELRGALRADAGIYPYRLK